MIVCLRTCWGTCTMISLFFLTMTLPLAARWCKQRSEKNSYSGHSVSLWYCGMILPLVWSIFTALILIIVWRWISVLDPVYIHQPIWALACAMGSDLYSPWSIISNSAVSHLTKLTKQNVSYNGLGVLFPPKIYIYNSLHKMTNNNQGKQLIRTHSNVM